MKGKTGHVHIFALNKDYIKKIEKVVGIHFPYKKWVRE